MMKNQITIAVFLVFCVLFVGRGTCSAQAAAQEGDSVKVAGGGVMVKGWTGKIDPKEQAAGLTINNAKLAKEGKALRVTTGPATTYWNPSNVAKGDYTVSATFTEAKYMNLNDHPHPYGIMIAGNDLGTDQESYLYCAAYGNGTYIVRGFGPKAFQMGGRAPIADAAINKAAGKNQPVTQLIAITVKADKVSCSINNKILATYDKSAMVTPGKLKSTDGIYGIRFAHNTDATVTGLKMKKER